jgi:hypothetical protein
MLDATADGRFPAPDSRLEVVPSPGGLADAIVGMTGHVVLAADIDADEVAANIAGNDIAAPMSPSALAWIAQRLGSRPGTFDALLCTTGDGSGAPRRLREVDGASHPRVERASRYRSDMRVFVADDEAAVLVIGRGVCGRWEIGFEVEPHAQQRGLGREVARAAAELVPAGEPLWAQVAPGNAASLRALLAAGYTPVGAEVLFPRPGRSAPL